VVVFGVLINCDAEGMNKLLDLIKEFNDKLENNSKMIDGRVWFKQDILIFHINNYTSMIDLPRWITYKTIAIKWRRKGYKQTFKLISSQKLLEALIQ
jgi:hypothetical protein